MNNIVRNYILYIKGCPGVKIHSDFKIGICNLSTSRIRLATYQNSVGPVWIESFIQAYIGDENQIRLSERKFKKEFKNRIKSQDAGCSEWISDITLNELLEFIKKLREEYFIKFVDVPLEFLPLTMTKCVDLEDWYKKEILKI